MYGRLCSSRCTDSARVIAALPTLATGCVLLDCWVGCPLTGRPSWYIRLIVRLSARRTPPHCPFGQLRGPGKFLRDRCRVGARLVVLAGSSINPKGNIMSGEV